MLLTRSASPLRAGVLGLATLALAAISCGGAASAGPADQFTGTWHYDQAVGPVDCGGDITPEGPSGNKTFAPGVDAALVDVSPSPLDDLIFCNFDFDIAGPVATAKPNQSCALTGGNIVATIASWTFTLTSATTADEVANMTLVVTSLAPTPSVMNCTFDVMAKLTRVAKD